MVIIINTVIITIIAISGSTIVRDEMKMIPYYVIRTYNVLGSLPQGQHAQLVAPGHDEGGQEAYVGELEQALLGGYPLARGLLETRARAAAGHGAVEREEERRVRGVVVRVVIIVVAGRPVRRDGAVAAHRCGRGCTTTGCGGPRRGRVAGAVAVANAAGNSRGGCGGDGCGGCGGAGGDGDGQCRAPRRR